MFREEAIAFFVDMDECTYGGSEPIQMAIKALEQESVLDQIKQILDDCDLEAWEVLEKIKEVIRA